MKGTDKSGAFTERYGCILQAPMVNVQRSLSSSKWQELNFFLIIYIFQNRLRRLGVDYLSRVKGSYYKDFTTSSVN